MRSAHRRIRPLGPVCALCALAALIWLALPAPVVGQDEGGGAAAADGDATTLGETAPTTEASFEERIAALRSAGDYESALWLAESSLAATDSTLSGHARAEREQQAESLRRIVALDSSARSELARADALDGPVDQSLGEGAYARTESLTTVQLELRRPHLPLASAEIVFSLGRLGFARFAQGEFAGADATFASLLPLLEEMYGGEDPDTASTLNNLAYLRQIQGDLVASEALHRRTLLLRTRLFGDSSMEVAGSLNNLAKLLEGQGDYAAAEPLLRTALAICGESYGIDHYTYGVALGNLGGVLMVQGRYEEAEPLLREGLAILRADHGARHPDVANDLVQLGWLLVQLDARLRARACYEEALSIALQAHSEAHPEIARIRDRLGELHRIDGRLEEARQQHREALRINRMFHATSHPAVAESLILLARVELELEAFEEAEQLLSEAAVTFEAARLSAGTGIDRATAPIPSPYPLLAAVHLSRSHPEAAWVAAERSLGRALVDLLDATDRRALTPQEAALEAELEARLSELESRLEALQLERTPGSDDAIDATRDELLVVEAQWTGFQADLAARYPVVEGGIFDLTRIQASLGPGDAIVGWLDAETARHGHVAWAYVLQDEGPVHWVRVSGADDRLREQLARYRRLLSGEGAGLLGPALDTGLIEEGKAVYRARWKALEPALAGIERVVVLPSGPMLGLPIEALVDEDDRFLVDRLAIDYAPSATVYAWLRERSEPAHETGVKTALILGDPPFRAEHLDGPADEDPRQRGERASRGGWSRQSLSSLPRLRWSRLEVEQVAGVFDGPTVLLGVEASEARLSEMALSDELAEFDTIHLATHALLDDRRPERSALVLSQVGALDPLSAIVAGRPVHDGLLTAREIVQTWRLQCDLVTLSACETALGREVAGEGYIGLAHALFQAGARSLMVSLWKVDDEATSLLMRRFYEDRAAGKSKSQALVEAKRWLARHTDGSGRRPFEHPYYWAAFVVIGDDR